MTLILSALAVAFAVCVWLGVRIFNRRERWARWGLATVVGVPLLYLAGFGPWIWLETRCTLPGWLTVAAERFYAPFYMFADNGPEEVDRAIVWYSQLWRAPPRRSRDRLF